MKRIALFAALFVFSLVSIVLGQNTPEEAFTLVRQFGRLRPQGIQYDLNFDRFVMVDLGGRLLLVDAATFETQHVLYEQGAYNAYKFSHDGRYLALAIDRRVELWDTRSGTLSADFAPDGANLVTGPLHFAADDGLLLFDTVVPAPAATRRSENDTSIIPWIWDLPAAREEAPTTLSNQARAYAFFNFRHGLVLGPNDMLIAGIPSRLQVINAGNIELPVVSEIESTRLEVDPIYVWRSLRDDFMYVDPAFENRLTQVDTRDGSLFNMPMGRDLDYSNIAQMSGLKFSNLARIIGDANSLNENTFLRLLLGDNYREQYSYQRLSVMLIDILQPLTVTQDQMGLLVYIFNEEAARGSLEFIRPLGIQQMVLHPDNKHLMVRRDSGSQPIEIYNLDSGILEQTYYPAEPDFGGSHVLAYNATGTVIVTDFQRLDARSGAVITEDVNYTSGFEQFFFTPDSRKIVTLSGADWRVRDIETGATVRREQVNLRGFTLAVSPDADRFLTQFSAADGEVIEIVKVGQEERQSVTIPYLPGRAIERIIPSDDWQNYLVVYTPNEFSQHYPGNEIAIYNIDQGKTLFLAGDDLPQPENRQYGWVDNVTVYISSDNVNFPSQPERIYGIEYDASGLPACLVQAYPNEWTQWVGLWEQLNFRLRADQLGRITQRLCDALPASASEVIPALTSTPRYFYQANATAIPLAIAGVPVCLTSLFQREALDYAELWREMSAGLSVEEVKSLEQLLCEGLISSVYGIAPTPTVDINQLVPPTSTPVKSAPETTTLGTDTVLFVMTVNIDTQERFTGTYIPSIERPSRNLGLVLNAFEQNFRFQPFNAQLSPDGNLLAATDENGFITIYRLSQPYDALVMSVTAAAGQPDVPRSIGLLATPTVPFDYAGQPRPTLTPTVTPTPPPLAEEVVEQSNYGQVEEICPAETLYDISVPPPGYEAKGRLFIPPVDTSGDVWVLEPETGRLYPDESIPPCILYGNCNFSPDQNWIVQQESDIVVSRPDGSRLTTLFQAEEFPVWPQSVYWTGPHTLEYQYRGYLPDKYPFDVTLWRRFDPVTGELTEAAEPLPGVVVNELSTSTLAEQPAIGQLVLVSTTYNAGNGYGNKYYIYDRSTGTAEYFTRVDNGTLNFNWHPLGRELYYLHPQSEDWYVFDAETRQHRILGQFPGGDWSQDGRYRASWYALPDPEEIQKRLAAKQRLPKISIWDSQTGLTRQYCIPETGQNIYFGEQIKWSPDNRYLVFRVQLPLEGDVFPQPVTPDAPTPIPTPIPLETQYQLRNPRTLILDVQTGSVTILSEEVASVIVWTDDAEAAR